jgi:hypothetical protein
MPTFRIDFEWRRDEAGYEYVPPARDDAAHTEQIVLDDLLPLSMGGEPTRRHRIVRRGGRLVPFRPFDHVDGIYRIFAALGNSTEGLLDFFGRFGPLTQAGLDQRIGEDVEFAISAAKIIRDLLASSSAERATYFSKFGDRGISWSRVDVALLANPVTGKLQLKFMPPTLMNALWLEFAQALSDDAVMRECLHCGSSFQVGPGTGRREDAKFCSDSHRIAFNSKKRSKRR